MRFVVDQNLGRGVAARLREAGHDADHVGELGLSEADDQTVLAAARERAAILVTLDLDFHEILALTNARRPSVILIRDENVDSATIADWLIVFCSRAAAALEEGSAVSMRGGLARIHTLPFREHD